jgi:hypothetical protein
MKFGLFLASLFSSYAVFAATTVPDTHFLYPVDEEINFLLGNTNSVSVKYAKKLLPKCDDGTVDPKYLDLCKAANDIRKSTLTLEQMPWNKLTAQVIYFGEMHLGQESKIFLAEHIADLKKRGIGAIGMEMFNSVHQDLLDLYFKDQASLEDVKKTLESEWGYESANYLKMIAAAKANGLRIIALDDRSHDWEGGFMPSIHDRDLHMAGVIAEAINTEPGLKVAVLCGRMHAFDNFSDSKKILSQPAILRDQFGISTQSLLIYSALELSNPGYNAMQTAILGEGVSSITEMPGDYAYADYMLFLR